jgi:hypothetical protein
MNTIPPTTQISTTHLTYIVLIMFVLGIAVGRVGLPEKETTTTDVQSVVDNSVKQSIQNNTHKQITITETDLPNGTKEKQTKITDVDKTNTNTNTTTQTQTTSQTTTEKVYDTESLRLGVLGATNWHSPSSLTYGFEVQKKIIGPVYFGAFGLGNGTIGMSAGLSF